MGINVLVVDDSLSFRRYMRMGLSSLPEVSSVTLAETGEEALEVLSLSPGHFHLITMDIQMPGLGGIETTRRIKSLWDLPILVISSAWSPQDFAVTFAAFDAGAFEVLTKPSPGTPPEDFARKVISMAMPVISGRSYEAKSKGDVPTHCSGPVVTPSHGEAVILVAVGTSTGGSKAFAEFLSAMPDPVSVPILLVQHMASGFDSGYVEWLRSTSGRKIKLAPHGEPLVEDVVYVAPAGKHMELSNWSIRLTSAPPEHGVRPSASVLFRSIIREIQGRWCGILLSGMGYDGVRELKEAKDKGALTLVQDRDSSVVWGMPGEAWKIGAATAMMSPGQIAQQLGKILRGK